MSPEIKAAWQAGFDAAEDGLSETLNPYDHETDEHLSWNDGHAAARDPEAHLEP